MKMKAYAKINLGLKVVGKREDGFHELEMLMINVNLFDILVFKPCDKIIVEMDKTICGMEDNIVYKTAVYIKNLYNIEKGIKIKIKKRIPDGGGMGGGSSDSACAIKALNKMWRLNLSKEEMMDIAQKMGSDVPFFIENRLSFVSGRGEKVKIIDKNIDSKILLIFPDMKCSTKQIFSNHKIDNNNTSIQDIYKELDGEYFRYLFNDLEETVMKIYPEYVLNDLKKDLDKMFDCKILMSGSGSSLFILGKDCLNEVFKYIKGKYPKLNIIKNKTISYCKSNI